MYRLTTLLVLSLLAPVMYAQLPGATTTATPASAAKAAEKDPFERDSPHGCVRGFLKAADREDYSQAAQYLDARATSSQAQELARELDVVINHGLSGNLDDLSRAPEGDVKDDLGQNRDRVGYVQTASGRLDILLQRVQLKSEPPIWLFSSETLRGVPRAFGELNIQGVERFVPRSLRAVKLFSLPLRRWITIIVHCPSSGFGFTGDARSHTTASRRCGG